MEIIIHADAASASRSAAQGVARMIREKPNAVLGLATGETPLLLYRELVRMHREESVDFSRVTTFNLDEYIGLSPDHEQSYHHFMWTHLFQHINVRPECVHLPDGLADDIPACCAAYERAIHEAGGIDLQVLGIGSDGHIGFNEPTSSLASRTRIKTLTQQTVRDNARFFGGDESRVPYHAITMGIGTIMDARMTLVLAFGQGKAGAVAAAVEGPVAAVLPASILQHHPVATFFLDEAAAAQLERSPYYRWVYAHKPDWQKNSIVFARHAQ